MLSNTFLSLKDPEKLRERIAERGLSIRRFAAQVNVSFGRIAQMTNGQNLSTSADSAVSIAAALDVDVADLFEFPDAQALVRLGLI